MLSSLVGFTLAKRATYPISSPLLGSALALWPRHRTWEAMMNRAEVLAGHEMEEGDGSMPVHAGTLIAWSCACLGSFQCSLLSALMRIASRDLNLCLMYEITNILWSLAQLQRLQPELLSRMSHERQELLEAVMRTFRRHDLANLSDQVLTSAFVSVATLPHSRAADIWLLTNISEELTARWSQLSRQRATQVAVAFQILRRTKQKLFWKLFQSISRMSPDVAPYVCQTRSRTRHWQEFHP